MNKKEKYYNYILNDMLGKTTFEPYDGHYVIVKPPYFKNSRFIRRNEYLHHIERQLHINRFKDHLTVVYGARPSESSAIWYEYIVRVKKRNGFSI